MKTVKKTPNYFSDLKPKVLADHEQVTLVEYSAEYKAGDRDILCAEDFDPKKVVESLLQTGGRHFLQKNQNYFEEDIEAVAGLIENPEDYFSMPNGNLLKSSYKNLEIPYTVNEQKAEVLAKIHEFIAPVTNNCLSESVDAIFEELFMNSMMDAPREYEKTHHNKAERDQIPKKFHLQLSSNRLAIACEDPYGSLDVTKFVARMNEVYQKGAGEVINLHRPGGAGLGCVLMFEHCTSMFIGVKPHELTLVGCLLPLGVSYRQKAAIKKSIHLIKI